MFVSYNQCMDSVREIWLGAEGQWADPLMRSWGEVDKSALERLYAKHVDHKDPDVRCIVDRYTAARGDMFKALESLNDRRFAQLH